MATVEVPATPAAPPLGAIPTPDGVTFRLWSTTTSNAAVILIGKDGHQEWRPLKAVGNGVFEGTFGDVQGGQRYLFELDRKPLPDPYARYLPEGPHRPAEVWRPTYAFTNAAPSLRPDQLTIYEMHVGTFTPEGTYAAAAARLPHLQELGITCIELMPLSAAAGTRGWGYDGVAPFAPFAPYGTPEALQAFVDAAHGHGIAVILDVVYNHFGPAGNYLSAYSPQYFTAKHKTPWGDALDYANPYMRRMALDSAEHWLRTFRFDGFRLDATHEIYDDGPRHVLRELADRVHGLKNELGTAHFLFCEDDRNWPGLVNEYRMDGMWADDFHHQLRTLLTGERDGYFAAYEPTVAALAKCINRGWTYEGQAWTVGQERRRGHPADGLPASSFVYTIQNHDQIGNRAVGDRLQEKAGADGFLAASTLLLFLPMTPLIFQGQEWMTETPFQYFTDHEGELGKAITRGRTSEFAHFESFKNATVPDPQVPSTFEASKLNWTALDQDAHRNTLLLYRRLLGLRKSDPVLSHASRNDMQARAAGDVLVVERHHGPERRVLVVNFGPSPVKIGSIDELALGDAKPLVASAGALDGSLMPKTAAVFAATRV